MVQKKDKPVAVIVSPDADEQVEQQQDESRERFWRAVEEIGKLNADKDPDETPRVVTEVVEEVRQEHYERARRAQGGLAQCSVPGTKTGLSSSSLIGNTPS